MPGTNNDRSDVTIQKRDIAILRGFFESRIMTSRHVAALYFEGREEAAKKRLQKLKTSKLVAERRRRVNEPSVLFLTQRAFTVLGEQGILSEYPKISIPALVKRAQVSELTIRHELGVMDVKAAVVSAIRQTPGFSMSEFSTWPALNQFEACPPERSMPVLVRPDGFIRIHEEEPNGEFSEHTFFLELDRSTETQDILTNRAACYMDYYRTGGFAVRNGADRSAYKDFPFRVLVVLQNAERRNNTALRMLELNPPIRTQVWLTTFQEIISNPLGPIWARPVDCQNALTGSRFESQQWSRHYARQTEREALIEKTIQKLRLLEGTSTFAK